MMMDDWDSKLVFPPSKLSFILYFLFPERLHSCYIYFHCSYLNNYYNYSWTLYINCWVSAVHTPFNKISLLCWYHWKRGWGVKAGPMTGWRQVASTENSNHMNSFHLVKSQNLTNYCCWILTSFAMKLVLLTIVQLINKIFLSWSKRCIVLFWGFRIWKKHLVLNLNCFKNLIKSLVRSIWAVSSND
jgi:hypothetical protein